MRGSENGNRYSDTGREIRAHSGQMIDLAAPVAMSIADIATSLAAQVRFAGHNPLQPTIAQHSLAVERIAAELYMRSDFGGRPARRLGEQVLALQRAALMHDAAEAYVGDTVGAVKKLMRAGGDVSTFDTLEDRAMAAIVERYGCSDEGWEEIVHEADVLACTYEMQGWHPDAAPPAWLRMGWFPWRCYIDLDGGKTAFIRRAAELGMRDDA